MAPIINNKSDDDVGGGEEEDVGFSEAVGTFDTCIDTLGDEARFRNARTVQDGINRFCGNVGVIAKLALENKCQR